MDKATIQKELAIRELARRKFKYFIQYTDPRYDFWAYQWDQYIHEQIIEYLEAVKTWEIKKWMIFCPPRMGKTELVSKKFPAYVLWNMPDKKFVCCSYSSTLATEFGRQTRSFIQDEKYWNVFRDVALSDAKREWGNRELKQWWWYYCVWVWWSLTGKWFDFGIIDDPVRNREDAESEIYREKVKARYTSTFYTRRMDADSRMLVMCTRRHEDDLAWWLLEQQQDWDVLKVKAYDEKQWYIYRPLKKWNEIYWQDTKKTVWEYDWWSLYQQEPFDADAWVFNRSMFRYESINRLKWFDWELIDGINLYCAVDLAATSKQTSDYNAILILAHDSRTWEYYVVDVYRKKQEMDEVIDALFVMYDKYRFKRCRIETVWWQKYFSAVVKKEMVNRNTFFDVEEVNPSWDKVARIKTQLRRPYATRRVIHCHEAEDLEWYEEELLKFPSGKNDDAIDAMTYAISMIAGAEIKRKNEVNSSSRKKQRFSSITWETMNRSTNFKYKYKR